MVRNFMDQTLHTLIYFQCENLDVHGRVVTSIQTVLTCSKLISPQALNQVIQFIYGGKLDTKFCNFRDVKQVSHIHQFENNLSEIVSDSGI